MASRCLEVCKGCGRHERYGTPPVNSTNYLCLGTDAFRLESAEEYETLPVPADCERQAAQLAAQG